MKPFKVASFQTLERKPLQLAARELGHGVKIRTPSELATIRREVSEIGDATTDAYARGFLDAIEQVLAGLSAETKHRRAVAEDVAAARLRKNATKVLLALHSGCHLPSEIVAKTGLKAPAVSNELGELESEHLVERTKRAPGEDQRTSPRMLTIRGMQLAEELTRTEVSPTAVAAQELAPVFVSFVNQLTDEAFLAPHRLEAAAIDRLGPTNGMFVWLEFMRHAERQRIISFADSAITLTSAFYRRRLRDLLDGVNQGTILDPMKELAGSGAVCLRATTAMRDHWQVTLSTRGVRNVFPWCRDDARADQLPSPEGPYHILWENPEVMTRDLGDQVLRSFVERSKRRLCYVATPDLVVPQGIERIPVDANYVGG